MFSSWRDSTTLSNLNASKSAFSSPPGVTFDSAGNLFGVTQSAGALHKGSVFELSTSSPSLSFVTPPASVAAGSPINNVQIGVQYPGLYGIATSPPSFVTLTLNGATFSNGSTTITVAPVNGIATFNNLIINTAGTYTFTASDGSAAPIASSPFTVNPGTTYTTLVFGQQPSNVTAGALMSPPVTATLRDKFGNIVTATNTVTLDLRPANSQTSKAKFTATTVNGIATFNNLVYYTASSYFLSWGNYPYVQSSAFIILPASAAQLSMTESPLGAVMPSIIPALSVSIQDAYANLIAADNSTVTLTLSNGTFAGGASTLSMAAVNGIAKFTNLSINPLGSCTLTGSDSALTPITFALTNTLNTLASFNTYPSGDLVNGGVIVDGNGNLFGTTQAGGIYGKGTVYEIVNGSNSFTTLASFNGANGTSPRGTLTLDPAGNLYGVTSDGGASNYGTVFEILHGTTTITTVATFNNTTGIFPDPTGPLALDSGGNLYGITTFGGAYGDGTIFEIAQGTSTITTLLAFNGTNGTQDLGDVVLDPSGNLFTATNSGGSKGFGTLIEIAQGTQAVTVTNLTDYVQPDLTVDSNGNLYGAQGSNVFEILQGTTTLATLYTFNGQTFGQGPRGGLILDSSGNIYGTTAQGTPANVNAGTVFEIAHGTNTISTLASLNFNGVTGQPSTGVVMDGNGNLYGEVSEIYPAGAVFEVPAKTNTAIALATVSPFGGSTYQSENGIVMDAAGNVFGTLGGGYYPGVGNGSVYEIAQGSSVITLLASFNGTNGGVPMSGLTLDSAGNLFGTTASGGANNDGVVFEVVQGSGTITPLASFTGSNGADPQAALIFDASGNLFGTTGTGGASGDGTVFEIAKGSAVITTLASFSGGNGIFPRAALTLDSNGNLYGTTYRGGDNNDGTLFEVAAGSNAITTLVSFNGANGANPMSALTLDSSGNLFGTTSGGGDAQGDGTVFEIPQGTTTLNAIFAFDGANGKQPQSSLLIDPAGNLYGTLAAGSSGASGSIFEIVAGTHAFITLMPFNNADGSLPSGGIVRDSNGNIFGTTVYGGLIGNGALFELSPANQLSFPQPPTSTSSGAIINPDTGIEVAITDPFSNVITTDSSTVTLILAGGTFSTGSNTASASAIHGIATFNNLSISTVGVYTLTVRDGILTPAAPISLSILAPVIVMGNPVVNGNDSALAGGQRSMVDSIVYNFSEAVQIASTDAFTIAIHSGQTGTLPTLNWMAVNPNADGSSSQWVVAFSGNGVVANSIADGVYDLDINSAAVTSDVSGMALQSRATDVFYRLFADVNGDGRVSGADYNAFLSTNGLRTSAMGFIAGLDANDDGRISGADYNAFLFNNGKRFTGFAATLVG